MEGLNNITIYTAVREWTFNNEEAIKTYGHISNWDVSGVSNMKKLFFNNYTFNEDISNWDVSNVTDMYGMFYYATVFDKDISNWNVSNVTDMGNMFYSAHCFNQDISKWDVSNVVNSYHMLCHAVKFNQNIDNWTFENKDLLFNKDVEGALADVIFYIQDIHREIAFFL